MTIAENVTETHVQGDDDGTDFYVYETDGLAVAWNGSATFNVFAVDHDGNDTEVGCHTRYGDDTEGGPCTPEEAGAFAVELLAEYAGEER